MRKKLNLDAYTSNIEIILKLLYKKGYTEGKQDALKQFKKGVKNEKKTSV
jgi:hypothetical protein